METIVKLFNIQLNRHNTVDLMPTGGFPGQRSCSYGNKITTRGAANSMSLVKTPWLLHVFNILYYKLDYSI